MAALLGVEISVAQEIAEAAAQGEVCDIANDNGGGQVVLSGTVGAIARAVAFAPTKGVKRALPLPVSAPFHCRLMQPAADTMADALADVSMVRPSLPVVINVTARPEQDTDKLRQSLVEQVTGRVRWSESIAHMANVMGISQFVELGSGKVLTGLVKRIAKDATGLSVSGPADIEAFLKTL
jgi:[acyl-carrier-protein] S-malonyltransferase